MTGLRVLKAQAATSFLERRGGDKNSAQPCFRFLPFSPHRLWSNDICNENSCLCNFAQLRLAGQEWTRDKKYARRVEAGGECLV